VYFATGDASASVLDEWWNNANSRASSLPVAVVEGSTRSGISPRLAAGGEISGTALGGDGNPLMYFGVQAYLGGEPASSSLAQTSPDGSFTIPSIFPVLAWDWANIRPWVTAKAARKEINTSR